MISGNKLGDYQYDQYNGAIDYDYNNHDYQDQDSTKTNEVEVVEVRKFSLSIFIYLSIHLFKKEPLYLFIYILPRFVIIS